MRLVLVTLLVLLPGCGRWLGLAAARREVVSDALQAQRFPIGAEEATLRLRGQRAVSTRCDRFASGEVRCGGCVRSHCFQLVEEQGLTRVATKDDLTEAELLQLWEPLDAESLTVLRAELADRVQDQLIEQEKAFVPRWGLTAGLLAGVSTDATSVGPGGRAGVRRWFDVHLVGHAAFEYRYRGDHEVSLRVGLEVARWTEGRLWGGVGAPPASVSFFIGPLFRLPAFRGGVRTGVGLHITDLKSAPLFFEVAAETYFAGEASRVVGNFTLGIGL
ncbi:MAG: hypothetical protein Q8L48_09110 [Archangium sp.]|nr:hypothetical protein [Archangium sp.]